MAQPSPFSNVPTEADIAQQRKLAMALQGQAIDTSPVGHWTQALARAIQGGVAGMNTSAASKGEKARQDALAQALAGSSTFGGLSEGDRAIMGQDPALMRAVAGKAIGGKLDPNAGLNRQLLEAKLKNLQAGGDKPMSVKEWEVFSRMPPEQQQRYLTMKRAEKYLDTETGFVRPNPIDPSAPPTRVVDKDLTGAEVRKAEGKNIGKVTAELPETKLRTNAVIGGLTRLRQGVDDLKKQPGLGKVVGGLYQAYTPDVSKDALNARTDLDNLKVKISGVVLQNMRDMSKTGGAVGQVTEREWPRLENMIANLEATQGKEQFLKNLDRVMDYTREVEGMLREAYEADVRVAQGASGYRQAPPGAAMPSPQQAPGLSQPLPRVSSDADYDALPSGAVFLDPQGNKRRKP